MKIAIDRQKLLDVLSVVSRAVPSTTPLPIFTNVLLQVKGNVLRISSSNLELAISAKTELISSESDWFAAVPFKIFQELVSTMNSQDITITYDLTFHNMTVSCDGSHANIKCAMAEDFPVPAEFSKETVKFKTVDLKLAISHTSFSAAEASYNPVLNGIYIGTEEDKIVMVSTDSFRFSVQRITMPFEKPFHVIIPAKSAEEAVKIMESEETLIAIENDKVMFKSGSNEMICLQIGGTYLDYKALEEIKSSEPVVSFVVSRLDAVRACKQAAIFSDPDKQTISINVQPLFVQFSAKSNQVGDGVSNIVGKILGSSETVLLDYKYVNQILSASETEKVKVDILGQKKPVVFYCEGKNDFYHVIMPFAS